MISQKRGHDRFGFDDFQIKTNQQTNVQSSKMPTKFITQKRRKTVEGIKQRIKAKILKPLEQ